jgi:Ca-activated chloride channel family protein
MDRDFVLNIRKTRESRDMVLIGRDLDNGYAVLASFVPSMPVSENSAPRSVKILVDCSGSMNGDSILQARQAVNDITQILRPSDYFNIFTFGNTCTAFFDRQVPADKDHITSIRRKLRSLEADMGGTELALALQTAFASPGPSMPQDILLITDGEIWKGEEVIGMAKAAGHRVFVVGVGSSVSESFVRNLAHETGGACELVAPDENMAENIVRHFRRIYLDGVDNVTVHWPGHPKRITPKSPGPVFAGDTLHLFAFFADKPAGSVCLDMVLDDGQTVSQSLILPDAAMSVETAETGQTDLPDAVARCGIQLAIKEEPETIAADLALRYQLMSPHTRYIVVAERSEAEKEKGRKLPVLRKVPQMMAAGHAGMGSVVSEDSPLYCTKIMKTSSSSSATWIRCQKTSVSKTQEDGINPMQFVQRCNRIYGFTPWPVLKIRTYADLEHCGLPKPVLAALKTIAERHSKSAPEALYIVLFLHILMHSPMVPEFRFMLRLAIRRAFNMYHPDPSLIQEMMDTFGGITMYEWGPEFTAEIKAEEEQDSHA